MRLLIAFMEFLTINALSNMMWTYFPPSGRIRYGIVTGGTSDKLSDVTRTKPSDVTYSTCLAHLYSRRHGYAYYVEKQLEFVNNRSYGKCTSAEMSAWNKIPLLAQLIEDVEVLVWLDMDAIINENSFMIDLGMFLPSHISDQAECFPKNIGDNGLPKKRRKRVKKSKKHITNGDPRLSYHQAMLGMNTRDLPLTHLPGTHSKPFLWVTQDQNPEYALNINTAVMAVRRGRLAKRFFEMVWAVGNNATSFTRHDRHWREKTLCQGYWGWPWEQGAVWDVLTDPTNVELLRSTCVRPSTGKFALNTIEGAPMLKPISQLRHSNITNNFRMPPEDVVFTYHHSDTSARYVLKRMLLRGMITPAEVWNVCGIRFSVPSAINF